MDRANRAFRSNFQIHTDTELVSMIEEDEKQRLEEAEQELSQLTAIASLKDHPGWKIVEKQFKQKIDDYRSGKVLSDLILSEATMEQIGQKASMTNLVATELEGVLNTVEAAVEARKDELNGRPQRHL